MLRRVIEQYNFSAIIEAIINKLNKIDVDLLCLQNKSNIKSIQKKADEEYSDVGWYGNDALNRKILLDEEIIKSLEVDTLKAVFAAKSQSKDSLILLTRYGRDTNIAAVIYYGLTPGLDNLELMSNNDKVSNKEAFDQQRENFNKNTLILLRRILVLALDLRIDVNKPDYVCMQEDERDLNERFVDIQECMDAIMARDHGDKKAFFSSNQLPQALDAEVTAGFREIFRTLKAKFEVSEDINGVTTIKIADPNNIDILVDRFVNNANAIFFDNQISHALDRLHLVAGLVSETKIRIGDDEYHIRDLLKKIIEKSEQKKETALYLNLKLRLRLIENGLPGYQKKQTSITSDKSKTADQPSEPKSSPILNESMVTKSLPSETLLPEKIDKKEKTPSQQEQLEKDKLGLIFKILLNRKFWTSKAFGPRCDIPVGISVMLNEFSNSDLRLEKLKSIAKARLKNTFFSALTRDPLTSKFYKILSQDFIIEELVSFEKKQREIVKSADMNPAEIPFHLTR